MPPELHLQGKEKLMKQLIIQAVSVITVLASFTLFAHNKVVVIPLGGDEAPTFKTIFVTSGTFTGNLMAAGDGDDGPSGADNLCMSAAGAANSKVKGKSFKAWLSSGGPATVNGSGRELVLYDLPYHNVEGVLVFDDLWDLNVLPQNPILDESGFVAAGDARFPWVGITDSGEVTIESCTSWDSDDNLDRGAYGFVTSTIPGNWNFTNPIGCDSFGSLLCFEQ
jgi:hypothetical protein